MRTRRTEPPPRTPEEREAARAERQRRRAARRGEVVPPPAAPFEPDLGIETGVQAVAAEAPITSRRARNTAIFSVLTGLSRVAGLAREIVARSYFGTSGAMTALTLVFILVAPVLMPLFTGDESTPALDDLTVGLSQVLFPIVVLLGLTGLVVGILNAHEHFTIPALAPLVWNIVIIGALVGLTPMFEGNDQLYGYAIGVLAGTAVQLVMCLPPLRRLGYPLKISFAFRHDPRVRQVLLLMLPVSLGLGLINVSLLVNSTIGFLVSEEAPSAIDRAFRIYMLPQGMFSVAVATVQFPALSRLAERRDLDGLQALIGTGMRQIALLLIPSAAAFAALATPIVRLVYERGDFDADSTRQVSEALFWFSFSLPFSGITLLLTRSFFSLQRPWLPTQLAIWSLAVNALVSLALHEPLGIGGIVIGTVVSNIVLTLLEARRLRRELGGLEVARTLRAVAIMLAAAALLGAVAYGVWYGLDSLLGRSLVAQLLAVGVALALGGLVYTTALLRSGLPEARQIVDLLARRLRRGPS